MDYKSLYFNDKVLQSSHFPGTGTCFVVSVPLFLSRFVRRSRLEALGVDEDAVAQAPVEAGRLAAVDGVGVAAPGFVRGDDAIRDVYIRSSAICSRRTISSPLNW